MFLCDVVESTKDKPMVSALLAADTCESVGGSSFYEFGIAIAPMGMEGCS